MKSKEDFLPKETEKSILSTIDVYRHATRLQQLEQAKLNARMSPGSFEQYLIEAGTERYGSNFEESFHLTKDSEVVKGLFNIFGKDNQVSRTNDYTELDTFISDQILSNFYQVVQPSSLVENKISTLYNQIVQMSDSFLENVVESENDYQLQSTYINSLYGIINDFEAEVINSNAIPYGDKQQLLSFSTTLYFSASPALSDAYSFAVYSETIGLMAKVNGGFKRFLKALAVGIITMVGTSVGIVAAVALGTVCPACFVPAAITFPVAGFYYSYELGCSLFDGVCA
ncbi:MAG: hypothetical protein EBR30_14925 [Cytophagia bacterium]|nr:hypothetical protein [Cytophagia bacterium]